MRVSAASALALTLAVVLAAPGCRDDKRGSDASGRAVAPEPPPTAPVAPAPADGGVAATGPGPAAVDQAPARPDGHDFIAEVRGLHDMVLCAGDGPWPRVASHRARHCKRIADSQARYRTRWLEPAGAFLAQVVPADLPTTVVYPFAGGDLSTALAVFPGAREITTLSLEPAGDPRTLAALRDKELVAALDVVADELDFLYKINFSNTRNLIDAMRGARLPTQLLFSLSALDLHGYELLAVYYFRIGPDGELDYLDDDDLASAPAVGAEQARHRNRLFGDVELRFRRPGEPGERVYRHIAGNLRDDALSTDDRVLRHLSRKGRVAAMTKAASYLLGWDEFSRIRGWLIDHAVWMASDASGIPPQFAGPAGLHQEVWGTFNGAHMRAGRRSDVSYRKLFAAAPARPMPVRFGYPDNKGKSHFIITTHQP